MFKQMNDMSLKSQWKSFVLHKYVHGADAGDGVQLRLQAPQ